jgi:hypothetical protein
MTCSASASDHALGLRDRPAGVDQVDLVLDSEEVPAAAEIVLEPAFRLGCGSPTAPVPVQLRNRCICWVFALYVLTGGPLSTEGGRR